MIVGNDGIYSVLSVVYNLVVLCIFLFHALSTLGITFLKIRGKSEHSTVGRHMVARKKQERLFNFEVAFVAVSLTQAILTGYIEKVFSILFGILITVTFPAVMVDTVYAALYVRKNPDYDKLI